MDYFIEITTELRSRCVELFGLFDELKTPDDLRDFARTTELRFVKKCVPNASEINHDRLIYKLLNTGRSFLEPAMFDLLDALAARYKGDLKGQFCEELKEELRKAIPYPEDLEQSKDYQTLVEISALKFYSCFISFTESDDALSERLYNDLKASGVRCWRWKEDAKWGKTLMKSVDEAVRDYDKLIVICSEQSLNSPPVVREIERALQKEDELVRQGKEQETLFPIRVDDYIFSGWNHPRKADVLAKHVGDFCMWRELEVYRKQLNRLVRDLKTNADAEQPARE